MFYTYILISKSNGKLYIGQTNNLEDRLKRHNSNYNKYTANKGPWKIIFSKSFETRQEAVQLELKLKSMKNKQRLLSWITKNNGSEHPDW